MAQNKFLTLLPATHAAFAATTFAQEDAALTAATIEITEKTSRSSSTTSAASTASPRSSIDEGIAGTAQKSQFLKLGN